MSVRGNGCVAADFNLDGWTDLFVTAYGPNLLLWNNGDGTFSEGASAAGVDAPEWNAGAVVGDLNGDGWPDLFVTSYIDFDNKIPKPSGAFPQDYYGLPDRLYLNQGPIERLSAAMERRRSPFGKSPFRQAWCVRSVVWGPSSPTSISTAIWISTLPTTAIPTVSTPTCPGPAASRPTRKGWAFALSI